MFDQYGMPQQSQLVQQQSQRAGQTGQRAPRSTGPMYPGTNTGINGGASYYQQPQQPTGAFNLEAIRSRLGFGKANMSDPQAWLSANQDVASGATIRGDKMYGPSGNYLADVVSNYKSGGTASQFLDGIGSNGQARSGVSTRTAGSGGSIGGYSPYRPGKLPQTNFQVYKPGQLAQYQNVDQSGTEANIMKAVNEALAGGSLSPQVQAQMQAQLKDQALTMQQGNEQNIRQGFAGSGIRGGGQEAALLAALAQDTQSGLLNDYRDLAVDAAQINRGDLERAIALGDGSLNNQIQRHTQQFDTTQRGQLNQEDLNQTGIQSANAATQFALQRALEEEGLKQAAAGLGLTERGQTLDNSQFYAGLNQADRHFGQNLGYNYTQLGVNNNNTQQAALLRALGLA